MPDQKSPSIASGCFYRPMEVIGLYIVWGLFFVAGTNLHRVFGGEDSLRRYQLLESPVFLLPIVYLVYTRRKPLLLLSRWVPQRVDLAGVPLGLVVAALRLFPYSEPARRLHPLHADAESLTLFFVSVVIAPPLEEIVFRGVFLRSLEAYVPRVIAILIVTVLSVLGHPSENFYIVLPSQLLLCILYTELKHSLAASMLCHMALNVFAFLPVIGLYSRLS